MSRRELQAELIRLEKAWVGPQGSDFDTAWEPLPGLKPFGEDVRVSPDIRFPQDGPLSVDCVSTIKDMWESGHSARDSCLRQNGGKDSLKHFHCYPISFRGKGALAWYSWRVKNAPAKPDYWWCGSLSEAALNYSWTHYSGGSFEQLSSALQSAMRMGSPMYVAAVCCKILDWGGVRHRPNAARVDWILDAYQAGALIADIEKAVSGLRDSLNSELDHLFGKTYPRIPMTSGTTKIFAAASMVVGCSGTMPKQDVLIFDGRVGAALGLLSRQVMHGNVPVEFRFPWGHGARRNPSCDHVRFPSITTLTDARRAEFARLASRCIQQVIGKYGPSSEFVDAEKALFMVGYDVNTRCNRLLRGCR